ncbi:symmetrical bis(5'-nucleosyl)-tetraphosphatase [Acidihalobacter ferrooxydans]|uniref:Bis(5'-nucleosyl)-tetraphosphatase, symmetrical n=1 Tax=Acidihalobacter ferrooxydans TaxID=1765967 RepID=A0A1P8UIL1_9GAMM|nr:symmetrical bis(5'-nucleosyl)-tetraphosphatase [Acidihalobacter ferrooxydans]APZ43668.1 bis(5'-nucleosyl)-tetraphosphatase (symmetrical) [Acidihalobacter ferrooxydans]
MAVYAVGDLQGCLEPLHRLLDRLRFDPAADQLWLVGDLVNRGPQSLETLRFVRGLGAAATAVLGNHDLHLLALAAGVGKPKRSDTLQTVLDAPDAGELLDWLRHRPLLHHDAALGWTLVHAGLPPQWDLAQARACAAEVEQALRSSQSAQFFAHMYGDQPTHWSASLSGTQRLRYVMNALTRMRYITADGGLEHVCKTAPEQAPAGLTPWFRVPHRRNRDVRIVFGHWSTLNLIREANLLALDTGCLWGGTLTAAQLDDPDLGITAVACAQAKRPNTAKKRRRRREDR